MGKRSIKENKNIYQISRENQELTREKAAEQMEFISSDRIEKIESEKSMPHPDEILVMAKCYKAPLLSNYYCSHECPIGQRYVPELEDKTLSQIVLEMLNSLNELNKKKDRLVEISVDGQISEDEYEDFARIQAQLATLSCSVESMRIWMEKMILDGKIDAEKLDEVRKSIQ